MNFLGYLFLIVASQAGTSMHGIRNAKCGNDEAEAKTFVFEKLQTDPKLCDAGSTASQVGGWSCRSGGECPKGKFRCNTQFECRRGTAAAATTDAPEPTFAPEPMTKVPAPEANPNPIPTPKTSDSSIGSVQDIAKKLIAPTQRAIDEKTKVLDSLE